MGADLGTGGGVGKFRSTESARDTKSFSRSRGGGAESAELVLELEAELVLGLEIVELMLGGAEMSSAKLS